MSNLAEDTKSNGRTCKSATDDGTIQVLSATMVQSKHIDKFPSKMKISLVADERRIPKVGADIFVNRL
jgi:hypothetical protein